MYNETEPFQTLDIIPYATRKCVVQYRNLRVAYGSHNWTCEDFRLRNCENGRTYFIAKITAIYLDENIYVILKDRSSTWTCAGPMNLNPATWRKTKTVTSQQMSVKQKGLKPFAMALNNPNSAPLRTL